MNAGNTSGINKYDGYKKRKVETVRINQAINAENQGRLISSGSSDRSDGSIRPVGSGLKVPVSVRPVGLTGLVSQNTVRPVGPTGPTSAENAQEGLEARVWVLV